MTAHGYHHHTSDTGIVVTVSTVGDLTEAGYSVVWRCGPNVCDVVTVETVNRGKPLQHFRTTSNRWRLT